VRRPTTTSSDQILINRLGTMAEPFPGLCLVAVRGFSVMVAGAMLAVYALLAVRQPAEPDEGLLLRPFDAAPAGLLRLDGRVDVHWSPKKPWPAAGA
jgi:hypothetical protein